ncbi:MAG: Hsp20/alpha crystallin family protein [Planctomycetes bacterium]|nr:Hsp20/alpha crystallin family protein [Planctomycetota bacterium]
MAFDKFGAGEGLDDWSRKIGDLMDEMMTRSFVHFRHHGTWEPSTNLYETRDAYYVCVELSGIDESQMDVQCADGRKLTISGQRDQPRPPNVDGPLSVYALEIDEGPFRREIEIPEPVVADRVIAVYTKGFLWITLPRVEPD